MSILPLVIHLPSHHVRVSSGHRPLVGVKSKRLVGDLGECASVILCSFDWYRWKSSNDSN